LDDFVAGLKPSAKHKYLQPILFLAEECDYMTRLISLNRCPKCRGEGRIWDFSDHEEPNFYWCDMCKGQNMMGN